MNYNCNKKFSNSMQDYTFIIKKININQFKQLFKSIKLTKIAKDVSVIQHKTILLFLKIKKIKGLFFW